MDESDEKGLKRRIDVKLVNNGQNYDPFYPIFQQLSSTIFARFKFLARFFVHSGLELVGDRPGLVCGSLVKPYHTSNHE